MARLSPAGNQLVNTLSQRYCVSQDAVIHMLTAVSNGNGTMAQFGHPEFGGSGQWMQGGMTMVSDLFNNNLKNLVNNICTDLANELANYSTGFTSGSFQSQSQNGVYNQDQRSGSPGGQNGLFEPDPDQRWWPNELGEPNALGSQNNARYAYFANSRRLAVKTGNSVWVYDTGDHQIGGFAQQQGQGGTISFNSQYGNVDLSRLPVVMRDGVTVTAPPVQQPAPAPAQPPMQAPQNDPDQYAPQNAEPTANFDQNLNGNLDSSQVFETIERLGALREKGLVSDQEFNQKKADLLNRL